METFKVKFDRNDSVTALNFEQGRKFYLGYENNKSHQVSVLFENQNWFKVHFGMNFENLNEGRLNEINNLQQCLKHNVPMWELDNLKYYKEEDGKYFRESTKSGDFEMRDGEYKQRLVEYKPHQLDEAGRAKFEANIANGLLVLCELV